MAGSGIGRIMARGLCDEVGRPAISPSARQQIMKAISEGLEETGLAHAQVELSIPRGLELAKETLNPRLGIMGGISILGSTGFVEPWNDHFISDRALELKGAKRVVVTTGRTGLKFSRILFPDHKAVLMGSQLDRLEFEKDQESILCGLPALILKWAWPQVLEGTNYGTVAEMAEKEPQHRNITLALERAKKKLPHTRIVLLHKDGRILEMRHNKLNRSSADRIKCRQDHDHSRSGHRSEDADPGGQRGHRPGQAHLRFEESHRSGQRSHLSGLYGQSH